MMLSRIMYCFSVWFIISLAWIGGEYVFDGEVVSSTTDFIISLILTYCITKGDE